MPRSSRSPYTYNISPPCHAPPRKKKAASSSSRLRQPANPFFSTDNCRSSAPWRSRPTSRLSPPPRRDVIYTADPQSRDEKGHQFEPKITSTTSSAIRLTSRASWTNHCVLPLSKDNNMRMMAQYARAPTTRPRRQRRRIVSPVPGLDATA